MLLVFFQFNVDDNSGNVNNSMTAVTLVTFEAGAEEACFNFSFVVNNETMKTEFFTFSIMNSTNRTEIDKRSERMLINVMSKDSRKLRLYTIVTVIYELYFHI